ncbi:MAG: hypothetical protein ACRDSJ_00790 [Rubrobacteraceae bacterium]
MLRRTFFLSFILFLSLPDAAFAHGFGRSQDIPLPSWLYLFGINAVVIATFVMVALSFEERPRSGYPRRSLSPAVLTNGVFLSGVKLLSVGLFLLTILSGLFGDQETTANFAPTFFWISWWVGLSFFTVFIGNIWPLVNPWKVVFEWVDDLARRFGAKKGLSAGVRYPSRLGVWPAAALYAGFTWFEILFSGSSVPASIAAFLIVYSVITWSGMAVFGKEAWLKNGEAFSVFYGVLGRFSPTETRVNEEGRREINVRPPAAGLGVGGGASVSLMAFVVLMLAGVTFDSLIETPPWLAFQNATSIPGAVGFAGLTVVFLLLYLGSIKLSQLSGGRIVSFRRLASEYVYSLVPIAVAYFVAHYYSYFLVQGQRMIALVSDPLGWGWNLFGTASYEARAGVIDAGFVWYSQVALILAGHIAAVWLAHKVALRLFGEPMKAAKSQYPMLGLMVSYTVFSLWILTQPIG